MDSQDFATPHNEPIYEAKRLPVHPPGQVIGRNRELASVHLAVKAGTTVLLSGPSGIGKTALGAVIATAYCAKGSVLWLNAVEDDMQQLVARVGRAYGVNTYSVDDGAERTRALLSQHRPLIVLDGLIDLNAARDFVRHCAIGVPVILINELSGPGPWTPVELGPLSEADTQALLKYFSNLHSTLHDADIQGLCKFLDGFPMTIELVGRLIAVDNLTPAEVMTMLPSTGVRDSQQTIMAIVFKRLSPAAQGMLLMLSAVFSGAATSQLISDMSNVPVEAVPPLMRQLVARGLARESSSYGQFVYTLHEIARQYALAWLKNYQRLDALEGRALQTIAAYAERHSADHNALAVEIDNLVGAAAYATNRGQIEPLQRMISALERYGFVAARGFYPELAQMRTLMRLLASEPTILAAPVSMAESAEPAVQAGMTALSDAPEARHAPTEVTQVSRSLEDTQPGETTGDLTALAPPIALGEAADETSAPSLAGLFEAPLDEPLEATRQHLDIVSEMTPVLPHLAQTIPSAAVSNLEATLPSRAISEPEALAATVPVTPPAPEMTEIPTQHSLPALLHQLQEAKASGERAKEAALLQAVGRAYSDQGDRDAAAAHYRQALAHYEALNNRDGMAAALEALAGLALARGATQVALRYVQRGLEVAGGDPARLGRLQAMLGDVQVAEGQNAAAVETYGRAVELMRSGEDWHAIGLTLSKMGDAYLAQERLQEAVMMHEQANVIFSKYGHARDEARSIGQIGRAYARQRRWPKAQEYFERALTMVRAQADLRAEATLLAALGNARYMQGDLDAAILRYRQALHCAYLLQDSALQAVYARELGGLLLEDSRMIGQAVQLLRESNVTAPENAETRRLLKRADSRLGRISAAGIPMQAPEISNREYAAKAYER